MTTLLLLLFFVLRLLSFGLFGYWAIQGIIVLALAVLLVILYFKNPAWAGMLLLGELFLGGDGHLFELGGVALRTILVGLFFILWLGEVIWRKKSPDFLVLKKNCFAYFLLAVGFFLLWAIINGIWRGHSFSAVAQDALPFVFLVLIFPARNVMRSIAGRPAWRLTVVFLLGAAVFAIFNFALFAGHFSEIHGEYYRWYREVMAGKITDLGTGFFRVAEPVHLLVVPLVLIIASFLMGKSRRGFWWLLGAGMAILALNLSRGYFLALLAGFLVLKWQHHWLKWLKVSVASLVLLILLFSGFHLLASGGVSVGWELFGFRLMSVAEPKIESSSAIRLMILPEIWKMIKAHPWAENGLGASVSFFNSLTNQQEVTRNFDWGYLELWAEWGIFGALAFLALVGWLGYQLFRLIRSKNGEKQGLFVGTLAGLVGLAVINLTAPAFSHQLGILYLVFVSVLVLDEKCDIL